MNNAKVYVVTRGLFNDNLYGDCSTLVNSVHTTREVADTVCQAKRLEQLEEELKAVRAQPSYVPELRYTWCVDEYVLES